MRKSDQIERHYARAPDRIVCENERWFVRTREGLRGPFSTRRAAEAEARVFVDTMEYLEQAAALPPGFDHGDVTVVDMDVAPWR